MMTRSKIVRILATYIAVLVALTAIWVAALRLYILPAYSIESTATIVELTESSPSTYRGGRQDINVPTYKYIDLNGEEQIYQDASDGFNPFNKFLYETEVGATVTIYLDKNDPESAPLVASGGNWLTFLLAPLVFGLFPLGPILGLVLFVMHRRGKVSSTG